MSKLPFELLLALRYLRPKRTFVSIITLISVLGVALGVAVLIIVISVMSGFDHDLRRDFPHAAYDRVKFRVPVYQEGDVEHRMQVRIDEVRESLAIIQQLMADLPGGALRVEIGELPAGRTALGYVEGWRGEIYHWIRTAPGNRLARCKVKDPSLQNWPALSEAILGNIVPDFPVVNKSFNLSYSGTDR